VLTYIFISKTEEIIETRMKLHNEELSDLCPSKSKINLNST